MSTPQVPLTYESVLDLIQKVTEQMLQTDQRIERMTQETDRQMKETDRKFQETREQIERTDKAIERTDKAIDATWKQVDATNKAVASLTDKVGDMVEKLLEEGNLVAQFRERGHRVKTHSQNKKFGEKGTADSGEIDLFMEDGNVAILVETKTTLKMDDVRDHIKRIEKYRRFVDADGDCGKHFLGAVAGTVIAENVINFAHDNGLYVIIQSARAVEIISSPDGFVAKKW